MEEQLCQIYIPASPAGITPPLRFYNTGLNGRYHAKVVGITWADNTNQHDHRLIRVASTSIRNPLGTYPNSIIFGNKGDHAQGHPGGDYPLELEIKGGGIDLEVFPSTVYDNTGNNIFYFGILSLLVKPM
jgi:hypothetical protein